MPVLRNRLVLEIRRGLRAFLNLDVGLTRGQVPTLELPEAQTQEIGRAQEETEPQNRELEQMRRQLGSKNDRNASSRKPSDRGVHGERTVLKRLNDPKYAAVRTPSKDAIVLLRKVLSLRPDPVIAEIGVGVGATTVELAKLLNNRGELHLFDYEDRLSELLSEIDELGFCNIVRYPNGRKTFDSYNWNLAKMLREMRRAQQPGIFDLVYLDGAHAFHHDAPAALVLKELLRPGGYLLFDDYKWTFASSPRANPKVNSFTASSYSEEQINEPHIALICELFFDYDPRFVKVDLRYEGDELRRAYQKSANY